MSCEAWFKEWQLGRELKLEPPAPELKLGISREAMRGELPVHGLRHPADKETCGWYIWSGEYSPDPDFFQPLHVAHLANLRSDILPLLDLPPGWRFYVASDLNDVWPDPALLNV